MVNVTVDNEPVSQLIEDGSSFTIPAGEVWRVNLHAHPFGSTTEIAINGQDVIDPSGQKSGPYPLVLTGGDTIAAGRNVNVHISGFIVSQ